MRVMTDKGRKESGPDEDDVLLMYGRAVYLASCLERKIAQVISGGDSSRMDVIGRERYSFFLEDTPAGRFRSLMDRLSEKVPLNSDKETAMRTALEVRNRLLHGYWWERSRDMETPAGRSIILDELAVFADRFSNLKCYLEANHA